MSLKENAISNLTGWWEMTYQTSVMWFQDFVAEQYDEVDDAIEAAVLYVEIKAKESTKGLAKEDAAFDLVWPVIEGLLASKLGGVAGFFARFSVIPKLKRVVRGLIKGAVELRNETFKKGWAKTVAGSLDEAEWAIEERYHFDLNRDGFVGKPTRLVLGGEAGSFTGEVEDLTLGSATQLHGSVISPGIPGLDFSGQRIVETFASKS